MQVIKNITAIPKVQKYRYFLIVLASASMLGPLAFLPQLVGSDDLCGNLCMRRFYLYFPGMSWEDFFVHVNAAAIGVMAFSVILLVGIVGTFFTWTTIWFAMGLLLVAARFENNKIVNNEF